MYVSSQEQNVILRFCVKRSPLSMFSKFDFINVDAGLLYCIYFTRIIGCDGC